MGVGIAIAALGPVLAWLSMSFILWDFDPSAWDAGTRCIALLLAPCGSALLATILTDWRP